MTPRRRLATYVLGTALVLAAFEGAVRAREPLFAAASHRVLTKAALLDQKGAVEVLFFGTSRTWDGVSPRLFADDFAELRGYRVTGFNLASTSSSLDTLEYLARRFAGRPGLALSVVEISLPQIESRPLAWAPSAADERGVEERLASLAASSVKLIQHRTFLHGENLARLPALLFFAPALDGSEIKVVDQLAAALGRPEARAPASAPWTPRIHRRRDGAADAALLERMREVGRALQTHGARVLFVIPPLAAGHTPREDWSELAGALAEDLGTLAIDYTALGLPDDLFRGTSHLAARGRALYTRSLAEQIAHAGLLVKGVSQSPPR